METSSQLYNLNGKTYFAPDLISGGHLIWPDSGSAFPIGIRLTAAL